MYDLLRHEHLLLELKKLIQQNKYVEALQMLDIEIRVISLMVEAEQRTGKKL